MAFTTDWSNASPVDHLKFKNAPAAVRNIRIDLEDRLNTILYGFVAGETFIGLKKGRFIYVGTGKPSAPPGTGLEAEYDIYSRKDGTGTAVELYGQDASGNEIQFTSAGKILLNIAARLANMGWLIARNFAGSGDVNILRVNTGNSIEIASHPLLPDTAPGNALNPAPKGYVDAIGDGTTIQYDTGTGKLEVGNILGSWADKTTAADHDNELADTDGLVIAYQINGTISGYTDASNPPTTLRAEAGNAAGYRSTITFPVRKGDYWKVTSNNPGAETVYWIPLGRAGN